MIERKNIYWASLAICAVLYFVWPTVHTIALRKLLLLSGAAVAVYIWYRSVERKAILSSPWFVYSTLLILWVTIHASFFSQNGSEAWREFLGQWLPPYLALLVGIGCALASRVVSARDFRIYLVAMLVSQSVFYLFFSVIKSAQIGELARGFHNWGITDHKLSLTFYADLVAALACAKIIDAVKSGAKFSGIYPWVLPIALALYVAFFSESLNGYILVGGCVLLTIAIVTYLNRRKISTGAWAIAILLSGVILYALGTSSYVATKLEPLSSTTRIALDIETYSNWRNYPIIPLPKDEHGVQVKESLYLRVAYATAGLRTIVEYPFGYGVTRHAFERIIQQKHPDSNIANSHNAYIDLVSAVGFPALVLLALVVVSLFRQFRRSSSEWAHPAMWMIGLISVHWMLDPISRDHYFETTLFLIGLLGTLTLERKAEHGGQA
jgi:hypothetical protein